MLKENHNKEVKDSILQEFNIDNCRVCIDIKDWQKRAQRSAFRDTSKMAAVAAASLTTNTPEVKECPPDSLELGRSTWTFLHTMAAYYPENPNTEQQTKMSSFVELFSQFYPCGYCASHLREELKRNPPNTTSREGFARWMCGVHNEVNERLGKPTFDCSKVMERWKDGPKDGSCF